MTNKPEVNGVCLDCIFINNKNEIIRKWVPKKITKSGIGIGILPPHFSLFLKNSIYKKIGLFETNLETYGLDSIWLLNLIKIDKLNILNLRNRSTIMAIGGVSTGSFKNILKGNINLMNYARKIGLRNWLLIPFVKILSKLNQFLIK